MSKKNQQTPHERADAALAVRDEKKAELQQRIVESAMANAAYQKTGGELAALAKLVAQRRMLEAEDAVAAAAVTLTMHLDAADLSAGDEHAAASDPKQLRGDMTASLEREAALLQRIADERTARRTRVLAAQTALDAQGAKRAAAGLPHPTAAQRGGYAAHVDQPEQLIQRLESMIVDGVIVKANGRIPQLRREVVEIRANLEDARLAREEDARLRGLNRQIEADNARRASERLAKEKAEEAAKDRAQVEERERLAAQHLAREEGAQS